MRAGYPFWLGEAHGANVLGGELQTCGTDPMTGFYRTGCCDTGAEDAGVHTVCAQVTAEFLAFSASAATTCPRRGPSTASPDCSRGTGGACAPTAGPRPSPPGVAPPVVLEATHARTLDWVDLADLRRHAVATRRR